MDRRDSYRLSLEQGQARVLTAGGDRLPLVDISAGGMAVVVSPLSLPLLSAAPTTIHLGGRSFDAMIDPVRMDPTCDARVRVGGRFRALSENGRRTLARFLVDGFLEQNRLLDRLESAGSPCLSWQDPKRIEALLRLHALKQNLLRVYVGGCTAPSMHVRLVAVVKDRERPELIVEAVGEAAPLDESQLTVVIADHGSVYQFRTWIRHSAFRLLHLAFPLELRQSGFRDSIRTGLPEDVAHVRLGGPLDALFVVSDVGARGFSFASDELSAMVPGQHLPALQIQIPGHEVRGAGVVRFVSGVAGERHRYGVEILDFESAAEQKRWASFVFHRTHPNVTLDTPKAFAPAWYLLNASDYISGWTPERERGRIARAYGKSWRSVSESNGHLLLLHREGRAIGTVAGSRVFPRSWMVHHLGVDRKERTAGKREEFLDYSRELYSAIMYMVQHVAETQYFAIWVEQNKRWNELLYSDFVRAYSDTSASQLTQNMVFKYQCAQAPAPALVVHEDPTLEIVAAGPEETRDFAERLPEVMEAIEIDAFSLSPQEISMGAFSSECAATGYERTRTILSGTSRLGSDCRPYRRDRPRRRQRLRPAQHVPDRLPEPRRRGLERGQDRAPPSRDPTLSRGRKASVHFPRRQRPRRPGRHRPGLHSGLTRRPLDRPAGRRPGVAQLCRRHFQGPNQEKRENAP